MHAFYGLYGAIFGTLIRENAASLPLAVIVWLCHLLVAPIVVYPLAALYICGPLISAGISMWRLIQHDYGNGKKEDGCCSCKDEDSHLQPALIILYSLAMLHGLLFSYRFYSSFARKRLVNDVTEAYNMSGDKELVKAVKIYLRETVTGCEKDPAFYKERNLATYAVEMIKSESSSESFLSGARILDALLKHTLEEVKAEDVLLKQALASELIRMASSSHVLEKLLQALDSVSPHNERTRMRELAANIMAHLAGRTRVMQFPQVIQRIGSLINISQQQLEETAEKYRKLLMEKGFDILDKLAATDEENCRAISNSEGLLSKVVAPLSSNLLHPIDHDASSTSIIEKSLQVVSLLVATPGETGAQLRGQISSDKEAIHGMGQIRSCHRCSEQVRKLTGQILTQLGMGTDEESLRVNKMLLGDILGRG